MKRPWFRRVLGLEQLESRQVMSAGGPSPEAQYMLELLNQARTNPGAAAQRYTQNLDAATQATITYYNVNIDQVRQHISSAQAQPPLAWNPSLAATATTQSQSEISQGVQTHTGSDGADLNTRLDRAGYTNRTSAAENTYAYSQSVDEAMDAFMVDWGVPDDGHFRNIMQPGTSQQDAARDVGIGIVNSNRLGLGPMVITQDFGSQAGEKAQVLGVVFKDQNGNNFYDPGEGVGDVTIQAVNIQTGQSASVPTWDAGGYQIPLDPGQYQVTATQGGQVVGSQQVTIGTTNVEVDFNLSLLYTPPQPVVVPQPQPVVIPVVTAPQVVTPPPVVTVAPTPPQTPAPQPTMTFSAPVIAPVASTPTQAPTPTPQPIINFSAPVTAPVASTPTQTGTPTPTFNLSWITSWTSWNASTGQLAP